jgi:hypothetical protein
MSFQTLAFRLMVALILASSMHLAWAADAEGDQEGQRPLQGVFGLTGDAGYYTYGMSDVNARFQDGGDNSINGGLGLGGALKFDATRRLAAKIGIDYLLAAENSTRTIGGTQYNSSVNLPATMILIGGEYVILPTHLVNLKLLAAYSLVSIFNGKAPDGKAGSTDLGSVTGSGSGAQLGAGLEWFLGRGFSLETDLAYNVAKINGATFAGSPSDGPGANSTGTVDYSGLVAKAAFTIYLIP